MRKRSLAAAAAAPAAAHQALEQSGVAEVRMNSAATLRVFQDAVLTRCLAG